MIRPPILLALGAALVGLTGCVDPGGPNYVESRLVNEGPVGSGGYRPAPIYRPAPVYRPAPAYRSTVVIASGPRYPSRDAYRDPPYRDPYYGRPGYSPRQGRYDRDPYYDRGPGPRFDRNRYCADVGYEDPRCD